MSTDFSQINTIYQETVLAFNQAQTEKDLYDLKVKVLGKKGKLSLLMKQMPSLKPEDRPQFGAKINEKKKSLEHLYEERKKVVEKYEIDSQIAKEHFDMTLPGREEMQGGFHPIEKVTREIVSIFFRLGFAVRQGPMIETDYYNFEALNIPKDHPSRDMQDTFYIEDDFVLRTHTSPIQIHSLETEAPPMRVLGVGPVFRCDSDISHSANFHQIEGMLVDKKVSMSDLKGSISFFVKNFFNSSTIKTRFRPSFFPFTEPSAEVDCECYNCLGKGCSLCQKTGWIEIGGCGLINPKVFEKSQIDSIWQGYAFGFGVERMAFLKYGVGDIRNFAQNDIRFLKLFV